MGAIVVAVVLKGDEQRGAVASVPCRDWYGVHEKRRLVRGARSSERWAAVGVVLPHYVHTAVAGYNSLRVAPKARWEIPKIQSRKTMTTTS